jgi:hypothetical protein
MRGKKRVIDCGEGVCPENAKTGLIDISFECSIGESYNFWLWGCSRSFIGQDSTPKFGSNA